MPWKTITSKQLHEPTRMSTCPISCPESSPTPSHMPKPNASKITVFKTKAVTPQTRGSVDYPSARENTRECRVTRHFPRNRAESPLYGELYQNTKPAYTCPKQCNRSNISNIYNHMSNTATWAHKQYSSYIPTMNPTLSNSYKSSKIFYSYTIHILKLEVSIHVYIINQATTRLSSNPQSLGRAVPSYAPCTCKIISLDRVS